MSATVAVEWVDVFTERPGAGNPAAVCLLDRPAPEPAMQALAAELGLSETAFAWPLDGGYSLRWFTPTVEVDLCGHATIATAHVLGTPTATFRTRSGTLQARRRGTAIEIDLPADRPVPVDVPAALAGLGARSAAVGRDDLLVELPDAASVAAAAPDLAAVAALDRRGVILTAPAARLPTSPGLRAVDYVLRFFGPRVGIPEDPATGSAHCLLGPWWAARLGRDRLSARQLSARGGAFAVTVTPSAVAVGGAAVTVLSARVHGALAEALRGRVGA